MAGLRASYGTVETAVTALEDRPPPPGTVCSPPVKLGGLGGRLLQAEGAGVPKWHEQEGRDGAMGRRAGHL